MRISMENGLYKIECAKCGDSVYLNPHVSVDSRGMTITLEPKPSSHSPSSGAMAQGERGMAELIDALDDAASGLESAANGEGVNFFAYAETARAAIAKANAFSPKCTPETHSAACVGTWDREQLEWDCQCGHWHPACTGKCGVCGDIRPE